MGRGGVSTKADEKQRAVQDMIQRALVVSSTHACYRHDAPRYQHALCEAVQTRGRGRAVLAARAKAADAAAKAKPVPAKRLVASSQPTTRGGKPIVMK
jgi:hypothetical protein